MYVCVVINGKRKYQLRRFLLVHNFVVAQRWRTEGYRGRRKPVIEVSLERWLVRRMHVFVVI